MKKTKWRMHMIRKIIKIDEAAVLASKQKKEPASLLCGCPGSNSRKINRESKECSITNVNMSSQLSQWPVQINFVNNNARKQRKIFCNDIYFLA